MYTQNTIEVEICLSQINLLLIMVMVRPFTVIKLKIMRFLAKCTMADVQYFYYYFLYQTLNFGKRGREKMKLCESGLLVLASSL